MSSSTIFAAAAAAVAFYLLRSKKKDLSVAKKDPTTTQELIRYKDITPDGIVELDDHQYRLVIEVEAVNMDLKSKSEQDIIWSGFRDLVNVFTIPATFLVQTRHLDIKDYISELQNASNNAPTPQLKKYGKVECAYLSEKTDKNVRDRRRFIFLKMDALAVSSIDSGIKLENQALDALISDLKPKQTGKMSDGEIRDLAHQELNDLASVIQSCLTSLEISNIRLDRAGVLDLIYSTLNKDMAPYIRLVDANDQEVFSLKTRSLTPHIRAMEESSDAVLEKEERTA